MDQSVRSSLNHRQSLLMNLSQSQTDDVDAYVSFCEKTGHVPVEKPMRHSMLYVLRCELAHTCEVESRSVSL